MAFVELVLLMDWFDVTAKTNKTKNSSPSMAFVHKQLSNRQREKQTKVLQTIQISDSQRRPRKCLLGTAYSLP